MRMALYAASRSSSLRWRTLRPVADEINITAKRFRHNNIGHASRGSQCVLHTDKLAQCSTITSRAYSSNAVQATQPGIHVDIQQRGQDDEIATVQVSNAAKMNIVNSQLLSDLIQASNDLAKRENLRAVILTGGPTAPGKSASFIGGADIKEMNSLTSAAEARAFITRVHDACQALRNIPVPVIARVNGVCLGAGLEIMASCDLRIATSISKFAMPEVRVGIPSVVEAALLPGLIGMGRTRRLLYLAETLSALDAMTWGLIEKVVEDESALDTAVDEWVETLLSMGPKAIRAQKSLMARWETCSTDEGIQLGIDAFAKAYEDGGREPKEYMGKFLNRKR